MAGQHRFYSLLPMLIHLPAMQSYTGDLFHFFLFQFPGESIVCAAEVSFVADISDTCWLHYLLQWYVQFASNCFHYAPHDEIDNKSALVLVIAYSRTRSLIHIRIAGWVLRPGLLYIWKLPNEKQRKICRWWQNCRQKVHDWSIIHIYISWGEEEQNLI